MGMTRRKFLGSSAAAVLVGGTMAKGKVFGANNRIRICTMGIHGRGRSHIRGFNSLDGVEVAMLCDVDSSLFESNRTKDLYAKHPGWTKPKFITDIREALEDKNIDAISIAAPNHWHALATIWACQAGKDVYVEKPCCHNIWEGQKMVEAAEKYGRVVQHGTQIRSSVAIREAIQLLRDGIIGEVYAARGLCYRWRADIGTGHPGKPPKYLDWNLWQGPAQEEPFIVKDSDPTQGLYVHYNWHWIWPYGNGDIGNQGVHQMDIARWGLGVELPTEVSAMGHMFLWNDGKTVPNWITSSYLYPDAGEKGKMIEFEVRPWCTNDEKNAKVGVIFYGKDGYMVIDSYSHYKVYQGRNEKVVAEKDEGGNHWQNFIDVVRSRNMADLHAPIKEGFLSSAVAHLGLISARVGRNITFNPKKMTIEGDHEAKKYLTRKYRKPFVVPEKV